VMANEPEDTTAVDNEGTTEPEGAEVSETETVEDTAAPAETDEVDEWTPPTKEQWEAAQQKEKAWADKLKKSNADAGRHRAKVKELERQNEDDTAKAQREALEAAQARYKPIVAKSALLEAKARTDRVGSLIKLLNMDSLEFNGDDEVVGLDAEVDRLATEYPEWFMPDTKPEPEKPPMRPAPKATIAPKKPPQADPEDFGARIAAQLLGK
jgi:DNA polymerase III gamma/tau subunit